MARVTWSARQQARREHKRKVAALAARYRRSGLPPTTALRMARATLALRAHAARNSAAAPAMAAAIMAALRSSEPAFLPPWEDDVVACDPDLPWRT